MPEAPVGSLAKGLALIELLSRDATGSVSELARRVGMQKSAVHRLLQVLRAAGWVRQTAEGGYACTLKLWELGLHLVDRNDIRRLARPHLEALGAATKETVHLSVLDGADVLYLDKIDSPQPVLASFRIGDRMPAYSVATGKAMLAFADDEAVDAATTNMVAFTPLTITSREAFRAALAKVRKAGYAENLGEWRGAVRALAAPVFDSSGRPVAALGLSCPRDRMSGTALRQFSPRVIGAARKLSQDLGYAGAPRPPKPAAQVR